MIDYHKELLKVTTELFLNFLILYCNLIKFRTLLKEAVVKTRCSRSSKVNKCRAITYNMPYRQYIAFFYIVWSIQLLQYQNILILETIQGFLIVHYCVLEIVNLRIELCSIHKIRSNDMNQLMVAEFQFLDKILSIPKHLNIAANILGTIKVVCPNQYAIYNGSPELN